MSRNYFWLVIVISLILAPSLGNAKVLTSALKCDLTSYNSSRPTRYVLLYKKDPSGSTYDQMCLDEIGSEEFDALTCRESETGSNNITTKWVYRDAARLERDSLRLTLPQDGRHYITTGGKVFYQCSVLPNPSETKSFIEQTKRKQLERNKI